VAVILVQLAPMNVESTRTQHATMRKKHLCSTALHFDAEAGLPQQRTLQHLYNPLRRTISTANFAKSLTRKKHRRSCHTHTSSGESRIWKESSSLGLGDQRLSVEFRNEAPKRSRRDSCPH